jgi:hypothetical protein
MAGNIPGLASQSNLGDWCETNRLRRPGNLIDEVDDPLGVGPGYGVIGVVQLLAAA